MIGLQVGLPSFAWDLVGLVVNCSSCILPDVGGTQDESLNQVSRISPIPLPYLL
ncbi:hypothetical protein SAMN06269250_2877 [Spirosoma fluviale]|uniref:Uncharacterized protein n=1 Tax=Spirosoma fluviale TaxID=1597977 RepID=A0A286G0W4_9BACT|nr:hypothetical protein SAMN06269250_2877 [Spirosoma fluviale]